ncbi:formyl transferase [Pseudomonas gingeri]|uniref:hydrogenase maturation protein n=2 Tax=Pseudomonas gingeri TaxID=117681 RepID=UPI0015A280E4|nr:hydrogenase maturation protein [Pseudomonas gingeri]NVZ64210.1 formyl transferase [Pseudomonas gingeri]
MRSLKIILLASAFNGLTQRAWLSLREAGHEPSVVLFTHGDEVCRQIEDTGADLVICPFLKDRVPERLWRDATRPVVIIHPGIVGDRGASALDWAITRQLPRWGVTALQAAEEMDSGAIWATREFDMPEEVRKSQLYNGPVADAALACIHEVVAKQATDFVPTPLDYSSPRVFGRLQPNMKQSDRSFSWHDSATFIKRRIDAADGQPGVLASLQGEQYYLYDAHLDRRCGTPGQLLAVHDDAVLVATGDRSLWIGALRRKPAAGEETFKRPARHVLAGRLDQVPILDWSIASDPQCVEAYQPIRYRRVGAVGELTFEFYNGAMSTEQCRRLVSALRWAKAQDTRVLVFRGGHGSFSNGVHLNVIQAAVVPGFEAWANIRAINDVCRELLGARQLVISGLTGSAGAGGVMLALAADVVLARDGIVLNPHYKTMGLYGSEYWTYSLPRAVGSERALQLTQECLPLGTAQALAMGLVQGVGPRCPRAFGEWLMAEAQGLVDKPQLAREDKLAPDLESMEYCRDLELAQMQQDMVQDRHHFAEKCRNFVLKRRACGTPERLIAPWARPARAASGVLIC